MTESLRPPGFGISWPPDAADYGPWGDLWEEMGEAEKAEECRRRYWRAMEARDRRNKGTGKR